MKTRTVQTLIVLTVACGIIGCQQQQSSEKSAAAGPKSSPD